MGDTATIASFTAFFIVSFFIILGYAAGLRHLALARRQARRRQARATK